MVSTNLPSIGNSETRVYLYPEDVAHVTDQPVASALAAMVAGAYGPWTVLGDRVCVRLSVADALASSDESRGLLPLLRHWEQKHFVISEGLNRG